MCLSTVYGRKDGAEKEIVQFVSSSDVTGESIVLTDVMGRETRGEGRLAHADRA